MNEYILVFIFFNGTDAYLQPLLSCRFFMTIIIQKNKDSVEIEKSNKYSQKNVYCRRVRREVTPSNRKTSKNVFFVYIRNSRLSLTHHKTRC